MEALLSPRSKNIIFGVLGGILAVAALWAALAPEATLDPAVIRKRVERDCDRMEAPLARRIGECLRRSDELASAFASGRLSAAAMEEKEALITEKDGVVADYVGEIYFFKPFDAPEGDWRLIRKNEDLYFQRRVGARSHYVRFFMDMRANTVRRAAEFPYPVFDLKFFGRPLPGARNEFSHDEARKRFYCTRVFESAQNQLILSLVFSGATLERHSLRLRKIAAYGLAFLFFLVCFLACGRGTAAVRLIPALFALAGMAASAWRAVEWTGTRDIYFSPHPGAVRSLWQLLILLFCLLVGGRLALNRIRRKSNLLALAVFNLAAAAAFLFADAVMGAADFPFADFSIHPAYLGLLTLVAGLYAAPLLAASHFIRTAPAGSVWPLLLLQLALVAVGVRCCHLQFLIFFSLAVIFALLLLKPRRLWLWVVAPAMLSLAVGLALSRYSLQVKRNFIGENLKPIFSSQGDYAKLVAREIVYELNSRNIPFSALFESGENGELADCWKNSLAARESIASGIHVVAADGSPLHSFSYQMPYISLEKDDIFPFWHVENVEAELFGKRARLAVATINVFRNARYLGFIMVQVLNTADLVLKSREPQSILSADRRIRDAAIGYIKLDESGRILENPANMNVPGLAGLAGVDDAWVEFRSMGLAYNGCVFRGSEATSIVFFPRATFFRSFSEYVKILGFLLLLAALLNLRRLRRYPWRLVLGSFSLKVFAILVLLSILTAAVFSLFSLNFNSLSQEARRSQAAHRRGRSALAIVNNLLAAEGGDISQSHLFLLEKVLEADVSVYENGGLLFTSDHRKLIRSELPVYLESGIRDRLRSDAQQFELDRTRNVLNLFFKAGANYVFRMEFPADSAEQLRARRYYSDFLATIFFVLIVIGLAAAFFFRDKILAPIHRLNNGMTAVRRGDLLPLDDIPAEVELRELYQGFNSMLEGIQEQKRNVSEIARMKTLVQLGRRVAHEVKNPLTPIRLSAEQIQRSLQDGDAAGSETIASAVRYIIEETEHLRRVALGFLNLSKMDEVQAEPFRLDDLVGAAIARMKPLHPRVRFSFVSGGEKMEVAADRQKIRQVIDNVLTNALEALAGCGGEVELTLAQEGEMAVIRVRDNGPGIGAEELERIANEEFSSKDLGTGLGLVIARRFLELHRGGLQIESTPGRGTIVTMRFAKNVQQA